ncbi:hypothetical protein CR513_18644, partial [Mucuna pruriens]
MPCIGDNATFKWVWKERPIKKRRSRTERLKVVRGECLACHHTLVDLILSALANGDLFNIQLCWVMMLQDIGLYDAQFPSRVATSKVNWSPDEVNFGSVSSDSTMSTPSPAVRCRLYNADSITNSQMPSLHNDSFRKSSSSNLHQLDLEIDRTLNRLRKVRSIGVGSSSFISILGFVTNNCNTNHFDFSESDSSESKPNILYNQSYVPK